MTSSPGVSSAIKPEPQRPGVMAQVGVDHTGHKEIAVVVALVAAEAQGVAHFGRRLLQRPRRQLRLEEVVREALVHENGAQLRQRAVLEGTAGLWLGERRGRGEGREGKGEGKSLLMKSKVRQTDRRKEGTIKQVKLSTTASSPLLRHSHTLSSSTALWALPSSTLPARYPSKALAPQGPVN